MLEASRLAFDPLIPWIALWVLVAGAVALWGVYLYLRGKAWLFRALALTVLALALANPLWIQEQREPLKDIVAVVMDRSESMNFRGRTETAQAAYDAVRKQIDADETLELRVAETDPGADGTDLYVALQSALSDAPRERIAGAILITDGQIHDAPTNADDAKPMGPVHALIVGGDDEIDRNIEIQQVPSFSIIDQKVDMRVQVNDPTAQTVPVAITINGEMQPPQSVKVGEPSMISFTLKRRGENLVVLSVEGIPNELTLANNLASARISGVQDRLRVLLVTGEPHAGARVWRDLLKSDPAVDLVHFTILRPPQKSDNVPIEEIALIAFPKPQLFREKLDEFDLVIFDHELRPSVLEEQYLDRVARYVERGGALLIAAGPPYPGAYILYN
ncbi:MAG: VWA domain-containing protein, partial [Hyphomonadaceae bacterium]|nr:VWA domain-containing protein [Hyphomonadaceae bacterium]